MFWKKKDKSASDLEITFPADKRSSYRVTPFSDAPVMIYFDQEALTVFDISAGGASFAAPKTVIMAGDVLTVRFRLPYTGAVVQARFRAIAVEPGRVRGSFVGLPPQEEEKIHRYVLEYQKVESQRRKGRPQPKAF